MDYKNIMKPVMLLIRVPIEKGDPLALTSSSDGHISSEYFRATDTLPQIDIERSGGIHSRSGEKEEVHLSAMIEQDLDLVIEQLRNAFIEHSFPARTRVIKMWRGDDFVLRNDLVFEHPEPI